MNTIKIIVNGENKIVKVDNLNDLLKFLKIDKKNIAIEINREIINKTDYMNYKLKNNDKIEIVNFIGGGKYLI